MLTREACTSHDRVTYENLDVTNFRLQVRIMPEPSYCRAVRQLQPASVIGEDPFCHLFYPNLKFRFGQRKTPLCLWLIAVLLGWEVFTAPWWFRWSPNVYNTCWCCLCCKQSRFDLTRWLPHASCCWSFRGWFNCQMAIMVWMPWVRWFFYTSKYFYPSTIEYTTPSSRVVQLPHASTGGCAQLTMKSATQSCEETSH